MAASNIVRLREDVRLTKASRVERSTGTLRNVKLLGWVSGNSREYAPDGVDPKLYEGKKVFANHHDGPGKSRDIRQLLGWVENCTRKPDGIFGDFRLANKDSEFGQAILNIAEQRPSLLGFSHVARGEKSPGRNGNVMIRKVLEVESCDLVGDGATVSSLFEGVNAMQTIDAAGQPVELGYEDHICELVSSVIKNGSLDKKAKLKKIGTILDLMDEDMGGGGSSGADDAGDQGAAESRRDFTQGRLLRERQGSGTPLSSMSARDWAKSCEAL